IDDAVRKNEVPERLKGKFEQLLKRTPIRHFFEAVLKCPFQASTPDGKRRVLQALSSLDSELVALFIEIRVWLEGHEEVLKQFKETVVSREYLEGMLAKKETPADLKPILEKLLRTSTLSLADAEVYSPSSGNLGHSHSIYYKEIEDLDPALKSIYFDIRDMIN